MNIIGIEFKILALYIYIILIFFFKKLIHSKFAESEFRINNKIKKMYIDKSGKPLNKSTLINA